MIFGKGLSLFAQAFSNIFEKSAKFPEVYTALKSDLQTSSIMIAVHYDG